LAQGEWTVLLQEICPLAGLDEAKATRQGTDAKFQRALLQCLHPGEDWPRESIIKPEREVLEGLRKKGWPKKRHTEGEARRQPAKRLRRLNPIQKDRKRAKNLVQEINSKLRMIRARVFVFHANDARSRGKYYFLLLVRESAVSRAFSVRARMAKGRQARAIRETVAKALRQDETATEKEREISDILSPAPPPEPCYLQELVEGSLLADGIPVTVTIGVPAPQERRLFLNGVWTLELAPRLFFLLRNNQDWSLEKIGQTLNEQPVSSVIHILAEAESKIREVILRDINRSGSES